MKKILYSLFFFLLTTQICFGQWVQVGLNDEVIKAIAVKNQTVFAVTSDTCIQQGHFSPIKCLGKVYRSIDNGNNWTVIVDSNAVDLGISRDPISSHKKFIDKYSLPFVLLSDENEVACNLYGVLKEKNMYGKKVIGIERSTFVIGEDGVIKKIFRKVKIDGHVEDVLEVLK